MILENYKDTTADKMELDLFDMSTQIHTQNITSYAAVTLSNIFSSNSTGDKFPLALCILCLL